MAPVQDNSVQLLEKSSLDKNDLLLSCSKDIKDEPPDEESAHQDEDFRSWNSPAIHLDQDNSVNCAELAVYLTMEHDGDEIDRESSDSTKESREFSLEHIPSDERTHSESSTPLIQIYDPMDSELYNGVPLNRVPDEQPSVKNDLNEESSASVKHCCTECGMSFAQASKLAHHLKIHSTDKPYRCSDCGKYFALQQHLDWHSRIHTQGSYYCCPVCRRKFNEQTNLSRHLLKTHSDEKPYKCFECGKGFVQASALKRHLKVHDNELALEEIGRVDSMFLIEVSKLKVVEDLPKKKKTSKLSEGKSPPKEVSFKDSKNKLIAKDREVENNLPRILQNDKQVKRHQTKSKRQKRQLTEIDSKLEKMKNVIASEGQNGRAVLGAQVGRAVLGTQVYNGYFDFSKSQRTDNFRKGGSSDKLPLKGNGTNLDSRISEVKEVNFVQVKQNDGLYGISDSNDASDESFSCRNCGENFRSKASLYNHVMCHIGMKLHDCSMCGKHFSETLSLERHYIYHITGSFPQECLRCGRHFFSYHDLRDHSQTHLADRKRSQRSVDQFKCNRCRKNFPSFRILESHIRSRCLEDRRPGKVSNGHIPSMKCRENTDNHMVVDVDPHLAFPSADYTSDSSIKEESNYSESEKFHSPHSTTFQVEYEESTGENTERLSVSLGQAEEYTLGMLDCTECGEKVPGIEAMMQHIKEHVAQRTNLKCPVLKCGKLFEGSSEFQAHIRAHAGEKPYNCSQCSKSFYLKENFDKHMTRHKTWGSIATIIGDNQDADNSSVDPADFDGMFFNSSEVEWHLTGQSSLSEQFDKVPVILGKAKQSIPSPLKHLSQSSSSSVIMEAAQNSEPDMFGGHTQKERMCASALVQLFRVSDSINALNVGGAEYRRYPRSGQCEVCLKFCSRLDKHMMVHLGQKPHLCPLCPQAFRQSEHLKRHIRARHEGNHRVFECPRCLKKLTRKDKLKEHMRNCRILVSPLHPSSLSAISPMSPISDRLFDVIPGPSR